MSNVDGFELAAEAQPIHIHIHPEPPKTLFERFVIRTLRRMEKKLTDISGAQDRQEAAFTEMAQRVNEDVNHLQDLVAEALATESANAAENARIRADAAAAVDRINDMTNRIVAIDPDVNFPSPRPSEEQPPTDAPTDEVRTDGPIRDEANPS